MLVSLEFTCSGQAQLLSYHSTSTLQWSQLIELKDIALDLRKLREIFDVVH